MLCSFDRKTTVILFVMLSKISEFNLLLANNISSFLGNKIVFIDRLLISQVKKVYILYKNGFF